ncbi:MAG TPA: pyruvate carboxylase subunit B, partial [Candidatus Dormibacteraeota bacterium]|nr:pyruvate carboxylase subunit B [Candidatus Dormibacteraeota bacterium]
DRVGYHALEVWGGATFEASLRYLNEDPWQRLRDLKRVVKDTPLQMILRGQNLVGYRSYPDDVVRLFVERASVAGVDIFRIYDGLNDLRNMVVPIKAAKAAARHVQGAICYTTSPVHTVRSFSALAHELVDLGCDSICIKDMAGLITPGEAARLVTTVRKAADLPVAFHTHCTSGMGPMSAMAAVEAGADSIDTSISPFAWGASQPPTESMVAALAGSRRETGLDPQLLGEIKLKFDELLVKYSPYLEGSAQRTDTRVATYQIPAWVLQRVEAELRLKGAEKKLPDVLEEFTRVRAEMGYPPLVTPISQVVAAQAMVNVLTGERYDEVLPGTHDYFAGLFGEPPSPLDVALRRRIMRDEEAITVRPADLLDPLLEKARKDLSKAGVRKFADEDLLSFILFPVAALRFLRGEAGEEKIQQRKEARQQGNSADGQGAAYTVEVDGERFEVNVLPTGAVALAGGAVPNAGHAPARSSGPALPAGATAGALSAPMQGLILKVNVAVGEAVRVGQAVAVLEAMKMQNDIAATKGGTVKEIYVSEGTGVSAGQALMLIE